MAGVILRQNPKEPDTPVIVVGSGLAGLTAAYSALRSGACNVWLLDSELKGGGNSIKASSGINGAPTRFQKPQHGNSLDNMFYDDTVRSAGQRMHSGVIPAGHRKKLISILTNNSAQAIDFLSDLGVDLSIVTQLGGHSVARTHRGTSGAPGAAIIRTLLKRLQEDFGPKRFLTLWGCHVTKLLTEEETYQEETKIGSVSSAKIRVTGVQYKDTAAGLSSPLKGAVVIATGGFAGDVHGLLGQYRPDLAGLPSTNSPRPGMHRELSAVGAQLVDMEAVQIHPTGFVDPGNPDAVCKILAAELLRGEGGILLSQGRRFVDELATREEVSDAIMSLPPMQEGPKQWDIQLVLDAGTAEAAKKHVEFYTWKGLLRKKKVKDLDRVTQDSLRQYSTYAVAQKDPSQGRNSFGHWKLGSDGEWAEAEVLIGNVTPVTHFTMGGVLIDEQARVLTEKREPIPGLWAAGEITGGIHGDNRLGGSSLLECVVYGQIAGFQAVGPAGLGEGYLA